MELEPPTRRQTLLLRRMVQGRTVRAAASDLGISLYTAKTHLRLLNLRIAAASGPHSVTRVHQDWPQLLGDLAAPIDVAPELREMDLIMLWRMSQGEQVSRSGEQFGLGAEAAKSVFRNRIYRPLRAVCAPQAVHHAYMLGLLPRPDEIRWAPTT